MKLGRPLVRGTLESRHFSNGQPMGSKTASPLHTFPFDALSSWLPYLFERPLSGRNPPIRDFVEAQPHAGRRKGVGPTWEIRIHCIQNRVKYTVFHCIQRAVIVSADLLASYMQRASTWLPSIITPPLVFALYLDCIQNSDRYNCICVYAKPCMSVFPM